MSSVSVQTFAGGPVVPMREGSRNLPFVSERPPQPPEGKLIGEAQKLRGLSARAAATLAGISDTRWRHIVAGYQPVGDLYVPVNGPPETVARMANAVGVTPEQLTAVGREDAAGVLAKIQGDEIRDKFAHRSGFPVGTGTDPLDLTGLRPDQVEAVQDLIRQQQDALARLIGAMRPRPPQDD